VVEGRKTLDQVCDKIREVVRFCDPAMMVKFWRICYRLYRSCCGIGDFLLLNTFLRYVRGLVQIYHGRDHPLFQLLDALVRAPQDELLDTLKVSYLRTIKAMESRLGQQHAVVLNMWSNYLKHWNSEGLAHSLYMQRYRSLLDTAERQFGPTGENTIAVLHGFMYSGYYNLNDRILTVDLALRLYSRVKSMPCLQEVPWWCLPTQGFALAAKLLAIISLEAGQTGDCRRYLEVAIIRLGRGDRECRTRALMLTDMLHGWLIEWGEAGQAAVWSNWRLGLVSAIGQSKTNRDV
jgi:hypothetical protein